MLLGRGHGETGLDLLKLFSEHPPQRIHARDQRTGQLGDELAGVGQPTAASVGFDELGVQRPLQDMYLRPDGRLSNAQGSGGAARLPSRAVSAKLRSCWKRSSL